MHVCGTHVEVCVCVCVRKWKSEVMLRIIFHPSPTLYRLSQTFEDEITGIHMVLTHLNSTPHAYKASAVASTLDLNVCTNCKIHTQTPRMQVEFQGFPPSIQALVVRCEPLILTRCLFSYLLYHCV